MKSHRSTVLSVVRVAAVLALAGASAWAQESAKSQHEPSEQHTYQKALSDHVMVRPGDIEWKPGPPSMPSGAQIVVLSGDPQKAGPFTFRFKMPDGYILPAHWHPADEHVTVISGTFHLGFGDKLDKTKGESFPANSFTAMPAGMRHFAWVSGDTVVQVHGIGPWGIKYVDPADDPRLKLTPTGRTEE